MNGRFHSDNGFCFTRLSDGSVLIEIVEPNSKVFENVAVKSVTLTPEIWASVVSSMSAAGETYDTWVAALNNQKAKEVVDMQ
jgi:hypothetical protein